MKACFQLISALALITAACWAEDTAARDHVYGTWKAGNDTWVLLRGDDGIVHVKYSESGTERLNFDCNTVGQECKTKVGGHPVTFSMYFNGDKLVQWERTGKETIRRRFSAVGESALDLETTSMAGSGGKPETVRLTRFGQEPNVTAAAKK